MKEREGFRESDKDRETEGAEKEEERIQSERDRGRE